MQKNEGRDLLAQTGRAVSVGWDDLEPGEGVESYTWFHVAVGPGLDVVVLSEKPTVYRGHYMAGAVLPCSVPRCLQCQNGVGQQTRVVFSVFSLSLGCRGLLELGGRTGTQIKALSASTGILRGLTVHLEKSPNTERGHILASAYAGPLELVELLAEQDPLVVLNAQWAELLLRRSRKEGTPGVKMRGEAVPNSSTPSPAKPSSPPHPNAPKSVAEAKKWIKERGG